jgi:hypothetical protein
MLWLLLVAVGVIAAYALLRNRPRFSHQESRWRTVARAITAATMATALWLSIDLIPSDDLIFQLLGALPELRKNGIKCRC